MSGWSECHKYSRMEGEMFATGTFRKGISLLPMEDIPPTYFGSESSQRSAVDAYAFLLESCIVMNFSRHAIALPDAQASAHGKSAGVEIRHWVCDKITSLPRQFLEVPLIVGNLPKRLRLLALGQ